jgi:hypothetical protein
VVFIAFKIEQVRDIEAEENVGVEPQPAALAQPGLLDDHLHRLWAKDLVGVKVEHGGVAPGQIEIILRERRAGEGGNGATQNHHYQQNPNDRPSLSHRCTSQNRNLWNCTPFDLSRQEW